jgi:citronellol/citronellal dehydrogenase
MCHSAGSAPEDMPMTPDPYFDFTGRVALVTGGSRGLGRQMVLAFAQRGADVIVASRKLENCEKVAAEARELGRRALPFAVHAAKWDAIDRLIEAAYAEFGRVDILVNNAGGQFPAPLEQISLKGLRAVHRLNVDAPWDLTQRVAARWMIPARHGFVAFVGFSPRRGVPSMVHSSIARSALETFAAGIALEWSRFGIRAVTVSCGLIRSEGVLAYGGEELVEEWARAVPLKRAGLAEEVAATIAFLASDGGGYVTGTTVVVDGGADAWGLGERPPDLEEVPGADRGEVENR